MDIPSPDSAPAALADLIAAGLVSHEMIGDPGRLAGEAEALETLCGLVSGSVWRIEPFHYAFRVAPGDLAGTVDGLGVDAQASALEGALQAALGADAVWVNAADLVPTALRSPYPGPGAEPLPADAPLLLLHAGDEARRAALEVAGPGTQAVIGARFALAAARAAAGFGDGPGEGGRLGERLAAIEGRQAAILAAFDRSETTILAALEARETALLAALEARETAIATTLAAEAARAERARAEQDAAFDRLAGAITALAVHIDGATARTEAMIATAAEAAAGETAAGLAELAAFRETVGVALAEFLAEIERRGEAPAPMPMRVPQFS